MKPAEVWQLTPAQYAAYSAVLDADRRWLDHQLSWVRAILSEPYRDKTQKSKPYSISDCSMYPQEAGAEVASREMSPDEQLEYVRRSVIPFFQRQEEMKQQAAMRGD